MGRGKREKGRLGIAYDCGVGCDLRTCCVFGDLRNLWRFLGLLRGGKYCYLGLDLSSWTHALYLVGLGLGGLGNPWRFPGLDIIS